MNLRTSLLLLVVLLTFGALWYATSGGHGGVGRSGDAAEPLFASSPLAVRVQRRDTEWVLRREGGYWSQVSPVWFPLTEEAGREVARALSGAVIEEKRPPGADPASLAELSLDQPDAVVEVVGPSGVVRVALGESVPGGRSYALVQESEDPDLRGRVVVLADGLHRFAYTRRDGSWFERRVPLPPPEAVVGMSLRGEGEREPIELIRDGGGWRLDDDGVGVRPDVVERMADLCRGLAVRGFLTEAEASAGVGVYGLKRPSAVWELREAGGRKSRLVLGRSGGLGDDSAYALVEREEGDRTLVSPILRLPPTVTFLRRGREALADPRVFPLDPAEVRVVLLETPAGGVVALRRTPADPASAEAEDARVDPAAVDALLGLTGERRIRPPDRAYGVPGGPAETSAQGAVTRAGGRPVPETRAPGDRGGVEVEHGLRGRIAARLVRRRGDWVFRLSTDRDRVEYVLDEASEDRFERQVLPLLEERPG